MLSNQKLSYQKTMHFIAEIAAISMDHWWAAPMKQQQDDNMFSLELVLLFLHENCMQGAITFSETETSKVFPIQSRNQNTYLVVRFFLWLATPVATK